MHMPTKARSKLPLMSLLAAATITLLGACAGESTAPLPAPPSGSASLAPSARSNGGYVVAEMAIRATVDTATSTAQTTVKKVRP